MKCSFWLFNFASGKSHRKKHFCRRGRENSTFLWIRTSITMNQTQNSNKNRSYKGKQKLNQIRKTFHLFLNRIGGILIFRYPGHRGSIFQSLGCFIIRCICLYICRSINKHLKICWSFYNLFQWPYRFCLNHQFHFQ